MLPVEPAAHVPPVESSFTLSDLVFVMGEDVIDATCVEVDLGPEIPFDHRRTLDVPAGKPLTPGAGPLQRPARLRRLPEREVARVALQRVRFRARPFLQALC